MYLNALVLDGAARLYVPVSLPNGVQLETSANLERERERKRSNQRLQIAL